MPTKNTARPAESRPPVKTTLNLPADAADTLRQLAADRQTTYADVVRRALRVEQFLQAAQKKGQRLVMKDVDDSEIELVIF